MFTCISTVRTSLETLARDFDPTQLTPTKSVALLDELLVIQRLVNGMVAQAALHVEDSGAYMIDGERKAGPMLARRMGVGVSDAKSVVETARQLEALPATDAAVRRGDLSAKQAQLIAAAATLNPAAEERLLRTAPEGLLPLKEACTAAIPAAENAAQRSARQHKLRSFHMWTDEDGMVAGRFRLTPEVGG